MLLGASSFQPAPSGDTVPLCCSPVCIRNLSSSCKFKVCLCKIIDPFALVTYRATSLSRAEAFTHRCQAQSTPSSLKSQGQRNFNGVSRLQDLQSLKEALRQQDDSFHSHDGSPKQDLQKLKGFLDQYPETQAKGDEGREHQRLPKAAGGGSNHSKAESMRDYPVSNQGGTQSKANSSGSPSRTSSSGVPQSGKAYKSRDARTPKHHGRRIPARGLDALDKLIASQGHTSRALIESLQATVALDDDGVPHAPYGKDALKLHPEDSAGAFFDAKVSKYERGSIATHESTKDNVATSSTFASSIEKALSPSTTSNMTSPQPATSTKPLVLEQKSTYSSLGGMYSAGDSDTAKPSLRGQEVLLALQKAAMEKAKVKKRTHKVPDRASKSKQVASQYESEEWRDAKPIIVKPEWAERIDELECRIENLKNPMPSL